MMTREMWSVSQLINYLNRTIESDYLLLNIMITGEVVGFTNHSSGHWYFSLKDESSSLRCAMFRSANRSADFLPRNGDKVWIKGRVNIFESRGELQMVVSEIHHDGIGAFYIQFEKMKKKLEPLGYFAPDHKKPIPPYPFDIAVVAGKSTAAMHDIRKTVFERWPVASLTEYPAIVQGSEAIDSVCKALREADEAGHEIIILARGGGSIEDLWCFNDEKIATAIYNCKTPVITGIGHEVDFTIADLTADLRAATPTAAAQKATPVYDVVQKQLEQFKENMHFALEGKLNNASYRLDTSRTIMQSFAQSQRSLQIKMQGIKQTLLMSLQKQLERHNRDLKEIMVNLDNVLQKQKTGRETAFISLTERLEAYSPLKTMQRGYSISSQKGKVIRTLSDVNLNEEMTIQYVDGKLNVQPLRKENEHD